MLGALRLFARHSSPHCPVKRFGGGVKASIRHVTHETSRVEHREKLNSAQLEAVTFPPSRSLQILAGPGTGKTRVIVSRIVDLVLEHLIPPQSICALVFNRKAAREIRDRLNESIGPESTRLVMLGTFHANSLRIINKYGHTIAIRPNVSVWNSGDCRLIIWHLVKRHKISRSGEVSRLQKIFEKAKGVPGGLDAVYPATDAPDYTFVRQVFERYCTILKTSNAVDFGDMIVLCQRILREKPEAQDIASLQHVLVDEFQDTSLLQYYIVNLLCSASGSSLSIVGDPDQCIYAWRDADLENFKRMHQDFPSTHVINLEENYRSTAGILAVSTAIISQDKTRPLKTLFTSHAPAGPKPVLMKFLDADEEARFIAGEIKSVVNSSSGLFGYKDCAILRRTRAVGIELKTALENEGIPYRVLPADTLLPNTPPVKLILDYLQLALETSHTPRLIRLLSGPHGFKEKVIASILKKGAEAKITAFDMLELMQDQSASDTVMTQARNFTRLIRYLQESIKQGAHPFDLIKHIIKTVDYYGFVNRRWPDSSSKNRALVRTLLNLARSQKWVNKEDPPTNVFLDSILNSSEDTDTDDGKVTLITCHSAKGLEWPIVFIPGVQHGSYPHYYLGLKLAQKSQLYQELDGDLSNGETRGIFDKARHGGRVWVVKPTDADAHDSTSEERRLFYVACTRAQCLLYLTYSTTEKVDFGDGPKMVNTRLSDFANNVDPTLFQATPPYLSEADLQLFRRISRK